MNVAAVAGGGGGNGIESIWTATSIFSVEMHSRDVRHVLSDLLETEKWSLAYLRRL